MKKHTFLNILLAGAMLIGISACDDHEMTNQLKLSKSIYCRCWFTSINYSVTRSF